MRTFATVLVSAAAAAVAMSSVPTGAASAAPDQAFVNVVNSGKVARATVEGNTVTLTDTALDRSECLTGVYAGTAADLIPKEPNFSGVQPVDLGIRGPQAIASISPSVVDVIAFPTSAQPSSATVTAHLANGRYTAVSLCQLIDSAGQLVPSNTFYFDEFTVPSASPIRFGSS
ncbi:hypothetical protein [Williamsia sp. M5A3_1d]